jgi:hypothetical protein
VIGVIVRNQFLAQQARTMNLDKLPKVKREVQIQSDAILAEYWLSRQREHIEITDDDIEHFRMSRAFENLSERSNFIVDHDRMINLLSDFKMAEVKLKAADSLKSKYHVVVDSALFIKNIPNPEDIIEKDPTPFVVRELYF